MISCVNHTNETLIYLDSEGIDELIDYLNYLKEKNERHYDLVVGNELEELPKGFMPEGGYTNVTYVSLINLFDLE